MTESQLPIRSNGDAHWPCSKPGRPEGVRHGPAAWTEKKVAVKGTAGRLDARSVWRYVVFAAVTALCTGIGGCGGGSGPGGKDLDGAWVEVPTPWEWLKGREGFDRAKYDAYLFQFRATEHDCFVIKGNAATFINSQRTHLRFFDLASGKTPNEFVLNFRGDGPVASCEMHEGRLVYVESKNHPLREGEPLIRSGVYERSKR